VRRLLNLLFRLFVLSKTSSSSIIRVSLDGLLKEHGEISAIIMDKVLTIEHEFDVASVGVTINLEDKHHGDCVLVKRLLRSLALLGVSVEPETGEIVILSSNIKEQAYHHLDYVWSSEHLGFKLQADGVTATA